MKGWCLLTCELAPLLSLLLFSTLSPLLSAHSHSSLGPCGGLAAFRSRAVWCWERVRQTTRLIVLTRLSEFQAPTIFGHDSQF